jgi:hypothetical protein
LFLAIAMPFIDNIKVKGLYTDYNRELKLFRVYRFIFEYLQNLNKALNRIKRTKASIKLKSQFCYNSINIISFVYNFKERALLLLKLIRF